MSKWMVDCNGRNYIGTILEITNDKCFASFIDKYGTLEKAVISNIKELGLTYSDSCHSTGNWSVGVSFDDLTEATKYLKCMSNIFQKAIYHEFLIFILATWSSKEWK